MAERWIRNVAGAAAVALVLSGGESQAQEVLFQVRGGTGDDLYGQATADAGDFNGDGASDILVGAPGDRTNGVGAGLAQVLSGADGKVLLSVFGSAAGEAMGAAVGTVGDLDADGKRELLIGAPGANGVGPGSGMVLVLSSVNGSVLFQFSGAETGFNMGSAVAGSDDINGDGVPEIVVGANQADRTDRKGIVEVFSGLDGSVLLSLQALNPSRAFGSAVAAGDTNGDGCPDIIVGDPLDTGGGLSMSGSFGRLRVFSGCTGNVLLNMVGPSRFDWLGQSVVAVGDSDGDGADDILVGAPQDGFSGPAGTVFLLSGATGSVLLALTGENSGDAFGASVSGDLDVNDDGVSDILVGAPNTDFRGNLSGAAYLYSGATGNLLYRFEGTRSGDNQGASVSLLDDCDGDGLTDLVIGANRLSRVGLVPGRIQVRSGNDLFLVNLQSTVATGDGVVVTISEGPAGNPAALFMSSVNTIPQFSMQASATFGANGTLQIGGVLPTGLGSLDLGLQAFALNARGEIVDSAEEIITIN